MNDRILYDIKTAAVAVSQSEDTIRRAIKATKPDAFPPPLQAKRTGKKYLITHTALTAWAESLADA
ncbi:hypothetical protein [Segeticoccus rhizosphaerae]|uniref:hypothetical protein n=1 Tax=Segeticoccus rhizosphaerae TaxID=1104777 RepID=UPI001264ED5B|nr:hypothetical protein [Segeticoccus rhizosphaerae]